MTFLVRFDDDTTTMVHDADAYEQEGPLTTFFDRNGAGRLASAFAERMASFRTNRIVEIRRTDAHESRRTSPDVGGTGSVAGRVVVEQIVLVDDDVPSLEAVGTAVDEDVARLR